MKRSHLLSVLVLLLSSSALHARSKSHRAKSSSPSPAPGPSHSDCKDRIYDMMACLSYLSAGSNDTTPEKACCDGIESVLEYNPQCICYGLETSKEMGVALNNTRAVAMPTTCKIPIAPPHCTASVPGASAPAASTPAMSPVSPSAATPNTSPSSTETSPSSVDSPVLTAPPPSNSGINNLLIPTFSLVATFVLSAVYISVFF